MPALLRLTSPKVTQKGTKIEQQHANSSKETPFAIQRQISKSNTSSLPKEIDVRKLSDKCLILKTLLNQHIIGQKKLSEGNVMTLELLLMQRHLHKDRF